VETKRPVIRVATGGAGTGFQFLGAALVDELARRIPEVVFEVVESPGSVRNVVALQKGNADVGLTQADIAYMAYTGHLPDHPQLFNDLRAVAVLHVSAVHVLVRADSEISSIADLRGRRVGMGPPGSGTAWTSALLLEVFGVPLRSVQQYRMPSTEAAQGLMHGDLDAVFVLSADPAGLVQDTIASGAKLLEFDDATLNRLRNSYPFLQPALTPPVMDRRGMKPVHTVGIHTLLVARAGLPDAVVADITRAFFEALPQLGTRQQTFQLVDPDRAAATPIPLHPGATRYYRERELRR
jgi:TRAP transporter TAXI family solute receptor